MKIRIQNEISHNFFFALIAVFAFQANATFGIGSLPGLGNPLNLVGDLLGGVSLKSAQIQEVPAQDEDDQTPVEDNSGDDLIDASNLEEENTDDSDE